MLEKIDYELAVIIHPQKSNEAFSALVEEIKNEINKLDGKVIKHETMANKILAYPIKKEISATYLFFEIQTASNSIKSIQKKLKENDQILRFLIVKKTIKPRIKPKKIKAIKAKPKVEKIVKGPKKKIEAPREPKISIKELDKKLDEILEGV